MPGDPQMILDHISFAVSDLASSREFYLRALAPLGIGVAAEGDGWVVLGREGVPQFGFGTSGTPTGPIHVAFAAANREQVRQFYRAALGAGGTDNGAPGLRERYHPNYYGAYVLGPDGLNIEAVCHKAEASEEAR
jgi:catechol 2,3-dioxygenase-like lactoylglutathione lyase family enzyme